MGKALPTIQQFRSHGHFLIHLFTNVHILKEMLIGVTFTTENFDHHTHTHTHTHTNTHTHIYIYFIIKSEKAMAPHSRTLAWKIPWTEEPGRLQPMGSLRVGHD